MATNREMTPLQEAVARNNAEAFARMEDKILPETWELNRWMLASLLAINSAAAAAVYSNLGIPLQARITVCWFFIFGALAALGSGFALSFVLRSLNTTVTNGQHYWAAVAGGAERSAQEESNHSDAARSAVSFIPQFMLYASAVLFFLGIVHI